MTTKTQSKGNLDYASCPSRLSSKKEEIMKFVSSFGKGCLHPFNALPYEYFEGGVIGREKSLELCCRLIDICDEFWLFGISEGTLIETEYLFQKNSQFSKTTPIRLYIKEFDPEWQQYYSIYKDKFGPTLDQLHL